MISKEHSSFLQTEKPELFSNVRRNINALKESETHVRKNALLQLLSVVNKEKLSVGNFEQIAQLCLKQCLKCFADSSEVCRQNSVKLVLELITRCGDIGAFLPYIFSMLVDRTNCLDLDGIQNLPQKMRPAPGQKPKVLLKVNEQCQQIRMLYCELVSKIISLADQNSIRKHLDEIVNILRALVMDPSPENQKVACQTMKTFCDTYKLMLLHYTETLGRSVLLPLISKKSKVRIAGLQTLTSVFWCGLWKYNAFVFENLIGFRDPNSVPIKDFFQPSHNINYLATFIIDPNAKVRLQFMKHIKIWTCDLDDKYDHHGKIVPYLLSGLFDSDENIVKVAYQAIVQIGRQIQIEREKDFRQNKQFAIDAAWTWQGKLVDLPLVQPITSRPTLGSRFFVRGHVRKMWTALYKEVKDLNVENRMRAANLTVLGVIFTQNYLTQFLDNMIPQLLPCLNARDRQDAKVVEKISLVFELIGRYCPQSAYLHIIKSALSGQFLQNEEFVKSSMKGLALLIKGNLEAIPEKQGLSHKKKDVKEILEMLNQQNVAGQIYQFNCKQSREIVQNLLKGLKEKASKQQLEQIMKQHYLTMLKILAVSFYEEYYSGGFAFKPSEKAEPIDRSTLQQNFLPKMSLLQELCSDSIGLLQEYIASMYEAPPSLLDADWKMMLVLHNYLALKPNSQEQDHKQEHLLFTLLQDAIGESLTFNKSVQILNFVVKYINYLVPCQSLAADKQRIIQTNRILSAMLTNFQKFKPLKKLPVYDQHLQREQPDPNILKMNEDTFVSIFMAASSAIRSYYLQKLEIQERDLADILNSYFSAHQKVRKNHQCSFDAIKTIWVIFERSKRLGQSFAGKLKNSQNQAILPKIIDFLIQRLQTMGQAVDPKKVNMIFSILSHILKCVPTLKSITQKITDIYPNYPELVDIMVKYTMNEKDVETRNKYMNFISALCRKMPDYFKFQTSMAEQNKRFERAKTFHQILRNANVV